VVAIDLKSLINKLNPVCQRALEAAAGLCLSRTNFTVEIEHWLVKLLEQPGNDINLLLREFEVDRAALLADLSARALFVNRVSGRDPTYRMSSLVREVLRHTLTAADPDRVRPVSTAAVPRPAHRPVYSVLSMVDSTRAGLTALRPWREALAESLAVPLAGKPITSTP
jgi:type VI secretion system protein VasG